MLGYVNSLGPTAHCQTHASIVRHLDRPTDFHTYMIAAERIAIAT